jgi:hypothetical protein
MLKEPMTQRIQGPSLHLKHEVRAGPEIPRLHDNRVTCLFQLPCDPRGPGAIRFVVADEKIVSSSLPYRLCGQSEQGGHCRTLEQ